jgi:hypothetical protein
LEFKDASFQSLLRVRDPERVTHLILLGGFAAGVNRNPNLTAADRERLAAMKTLMKLGWGSDDPAFQRLLPLQ